LDVEREIDLIEEIARIHGFDKFEGTLPAFSGGVQELPHERHENRLRSDLLALGYNQAISLSFVSHAEAKEFSSAAAIEIANPLSEEASVMRTSLVPNMVAMLAHNLNHGNDSVRLFEMGKAYELVAGKTEEHPRATLGATGAAVSANVHHPARAYNFFDIKGDVETLLAGLQYQSLYFDASAADYYHPGRSARIVLDGRKIGQFGQLHPKIASERKLKQEVFIAELDLERLFQQPLKDARYTPIPRFPAVERDWSFVFADEVTFERIRSAVESLKIKELRSFRPVEIFRGGSVPAARYSLLVRAEFQSGERTLRDEEVTVWSAQVVKALETLGGTQR
jgi:phenylalanyl-tRNA synthetase beta chain